MCFVAPYLGQLLVCPIKTKISSLRLNIKIGLLNFSTKCLLRSFAVYIYFPDTDKQKPISRKFVIRKKNPKIRFMPVSVIQNLAD